MQCDDELRELAQGHLTRFDATRASTQGRSVAAVAVTIADVAHGTDLPGFPAFDQWSHDASLVLTQRSSKLRNHAGQWAFPGGRVDPGETVIETALRELREEVRLELDAGDVLGLLDDFVTRSGFVITPVVVWAGRDRELDINVDEVASAHRIPITEFMRDDAPLLEDIPESDQPVLRMPVGDSWIAAPTAAMIYQFREVCIRGLDTRVAHYEQPTFAWR